MKQISIGKKIISAIPDIYSLKGNDYSNFVAGKDPYSMMRKNWENLGNRLNNAVIKVGYEASTKEKKTNTKSKK